jgi:hypothetical protein
MVAVDEREMVGGRYAEHLTDRDMLTLAGGRSEQARVLRRAPALILDLLDRPGVADSVLATRGEEAGRFSYLSPVARGRRLIDRSSSGTRGVASVGVAVRRRETGRGTAVDGGERLVQAQAHEGDHATVGYPGATYSIGLNVRRRRHEAVLR